MRLRTKLVGVVTGLVFLLVLGISLLYLSRSLRQYVDQSYAATDIIAHQLLFATRQAVQQGALSGTINPALPDPRLRDELAQTLSNNASLNALMDSVISYSPIIYDINITDNQDRVLLGTDPALVGSLLPTRPSFGGLRHRSILQLRRIIFGQAKVYDLPLSLDRNGQPFATVHIGMRTSFLLQVFRPSLLQAFGYTVSALLLSLLAAAVVASLALAPLEQINRRLDLLNAEPVEGPQDPLLRVSTNIERLSERMRNTEQVFSALKENMDQILSNLQDGMMLFTRDARAVLVSSSVERFLGPGFADILTLDKTRTDGARCLPTTDIDPPGGSKAGEWQTN
jgi:PAS domain-containing protein